MTSGHAKQHVVAADLYYGLLVLLLIEARGGLRKGGEREWGEGRGGLKAQREEVIQLLWEAVFGFVIS